MNISKYLIEQGLVQNRTAAFVLIVTGQVFVNGKKISSLSERIKSADEVVIRKQNSYVSRGGDKLEGALKYFVCSVAGAICLDAGAATGGFTDCLLRAGAARVYAVDVAYGKLDWSLRQHAQVVNLERHNIRDVQSYIPRNHIDWAVLDVSFTSLKNIIPHIVPVMKNSSTVIALVKPQFELHPRKLKKGIVHNEADRITAVKNIQNFADTLGFRYKGMFPSSIKGAKGNQEYFIYWEISQ